MPLATEMQCQQKNVLLSCGIHSTDHICSLLLLKHLTTNLVTENKTILLPHVSVLQGQCESQVSEKNQDAISLLLLRMV